MKNSKINVTKSVTVSAAEMWKALSSFRNIEKYSPVETSTTEGNGAGATRVCVMPDKSEIHETLTVCDNDTRTMTYIITTGPFPFENYESTVVVNSLGENEAEISWTGRFDVAEEAEAQMQELLAGFYTAIIDNMAAEFSGATQAA